MVHLHCPTPTQTQTRIGSIEYNVICVYVSVCAVWTPPHHSMQPIFCRCLYRSRYRQCEDTLRSLIFACQYNRNQSLRYVILPLKCEHKWGITAVADPGFPSYTGCQHQRGKGGGVRQPIIFGHCFLKTAWNWKEIIPSSGSANFMVNCTIWEFTGACTSCDVRLSACIIREGVSHVTITHDVLELTIKRSSPNLTVQGPPTRADIWLREGIVFSQMCAHLCTGGVMYWNTHHTGTPEPHCTGTPLPPPRCWHPMATESHTAGAHPTGMLSC